MMLLLAAAAAEGGEGGEPHPQPVRTEEEQALGDVVLLDQFSILLLAVFGIVVLWCMGCFGRQRPAPPEFHQQDVLNVFKQYEQAMKTTQKHEAEKRKRMGVTKSD
eukprot:gb/GECG01006587.1/.p1 GENE.gb/GECG01006587.1/~~gb/GECG01006587.1/.p1  ORF type:complete len:106 (+),score=18.84 gb/GECG01006587.1/:1-318(+)